MMHVCQSVDAKASPCCGVGEHLDLPLGHLMSSIANALRV